MTLLPPNASRMERTRAEVAAQLARLPVRIGELKNPDTCPAEWLPWLAWERSVDVWNPDWPEAQKRAAIRASLAIHKRKGTAGAVKLALATLDWQARLVEWHQAQPPAAPHTFAVEITLDRRGFAAQLYDDVERLVLAAKNARSHLTRISVVHRQRARLRLASAVVTTETVKVLPWQPTTLRSVASLPTAAALVTRETVALHSQRH